MLSVPSFQNRTRPLASTQITASCECSARLGRSRRNLRSLLCPQLLQQRLRLLEVRRIEALGEPAIERREQVAGFGALALVAPEAGEAGGRAKFPPSCTLSS